MRILNSPRLWLPALAATAILLGACGDKEAPTDGLLSHVPADTPYVFANLEPMPVAVVEKLLGSNDEMVGWYRELLARPPADGAPRSANEQRALRLVDALLAELEGNSDAAGLARLGVRLDGRTVLYGDGLFPVARTELADGARFEATLARIEQRAGMSAERATFGDTGYRRIVLEGLHLLLAIQGDRAVWALLPGAEESRYLPRLLGDERPATSLAQSGALQQLLQDYALPGHGDGYVDLKRLVAELRKLADAAGVAPVTADAACNALVDGLLADVPRLVMGTTEASVERYGVRLVAETSPAVGEVLAGLAHPVPGLGTPTDALFALGVGVDVTRLRGGLRRLLRHVAGTGGDCVLVDRDAIEHSIPKLEMALGPMTAMFKGLYVELVDLALDPATGRPQGLQARALAEVDDPRGVFALAGMANPALARLDVPDDGTPTAIPAELLPPQVPPLQVAIRGRSLVLSSGGEDGALVSGLLAAEPRSPAPLLALSYNMERLGSLMESLSGTIAAAAAARQGGSPPALKGDLEAMLKMYRIYRTVAFTLTAGERGLVLDETLEFR